MKHSTIILHFLIVILASSLGVGSLSAAVYIQPDESKELFKLEKIPLQVDRMKELSRHLVVLAKRKHSADALQQRSTAQLLALALRLDPSNQEARDINRELTKGNKPDASDETTILKAKARIRFFKRWLAHPDAGGDANRLSDYLDDATKALNPKTQHNKDLGNWKNVVPPLNKYQQDGNDSLPEPDNEREDEGNADDETMERDDESSETPETPEKAFHLTDLSLKAPYQLDIYNKFRDSKDFNREKTRHTAKYSISDIKIEIRPCKKEERERLKIDHISRRKNNHDKNDPIQRGIGAVLYELLTSRHEGLGHYKSKVSISGGSYARANNLALSAPLAIMLEASIINKPLREDLHVCASIDGKGKFHLQKNFWATLKVLRENEAGGRLLVPKEASKLLTQILVFGEPDFFTRWEVFVVDNLDEAMAVAIKDSDEKLVEADQLFDSIQNLTRKTDVTKLAVNRAVRSRLSEIVKLSPTHASAHVLLLQGSGKRPMRLNAEATAHSIMPAVVKMHNILVHGNPDHPKSSDMKKQHEEARAALDPLERLVDRSDDDLYRAALDLANDFRSLANLIRRGSDRDNYDASSRKKVRPAYMTMSAKSEALLRQARKAAGFPDPEEEKKD